MRTGWCRNLKFPGAGKRPWFAATKSPAHEQRNTQLTHALPQRIIEENPGREVGSQTAGRSYLKNSVGPNVPNKHDPVGCHLLEHVRPYCRQVRVARCAQLHVSQLRDTTPREATAESSLHVRRVRSGQPPSTCCFQAAER